MRPHEIHGASMPDPRETSIWTATPRSLEQLGLWRPSAIEQTPEAATALGLWARKLREIRETPGLEPCRTQESGIAQDARSGRDALLLVTAEPGAEANQAKWANLKAQLEKKNFLHGWSSVEGDLPAAVQQAVKRIGGRVLFTEPAVELLFANGGHRAAVMCCRWSAHLAVTRFVERTTGFRAEVIGQIASSEKK